MANKVACKVIKSRSGRLANRPVGAPTGQTNERPRWHVRRLRLAALTRLAWQAAVSKLVLEKRVCQVVVGRPVRLSDCLSATRQFVCAFAREFSSNSAVNATPRSTPSIDQDKGELMVRICHLAECRAPLCLLAARLGSAFPPKARQNSIRLGAKFGPKFEGRLAD